VASRSGPVEIMPIFYLQEIADEAHVLYGSFWQFRVVFQAVG